MGCSPSALLDQIHKGSSASLDKDEKSSNYKKASLTNSVTTVNAPTTTIVQVNNMARGKKLKK